MCDGNVGRDYVEYWWLKYEEWLREVLVTMWNMDDYVEYVWLYGVCVTEILMTMLIMDDFEICVTVDYVWLLVTM